MKIAVIGCGSIGRRHIGNLLALGCDVYGYDPSQEACDRAKTEHPAARVFGVFGGDETFDAWVIATPYANHLTWVRQAVACKMPFFVEKPIGAVEDLHEWRAVAARSDVPVHQVGYQCRFHRQAQYLRTIAHTRHPVVVSTRCFVDMSTWPGTYGDFILECSHEIDLALWLGVEPIVTYATVSDDEAYIALNKSSVVWIKSAEKHMDRAWSAAGITHCYQANFWRDHPIGDDVYVAEMTHFLDLVRTGTRTIGATLSDGVKVLEIRKQLDELSGHHPSATRLDAVPA